MAISAEFYAAIKPDPRGFLSDAEESNERFQYHRYRVADDDGLKEIAWKRFCFFGTLFVTPPVSPC